MSRLAAQILLCTICILLSFSASAFEVSGAWSTSLENCDKVFETKNNRVLFTHNSDVFGGGFIAEGNKIKGPAMACRITNRKEEGGVLQLIASCSTDIAVLGAQQISAKIDNDNQLTRIYPVRNGNSVLSL